MNKNNSTGNSNITDDPKATDLPENTSLEPSYVPETKKNSRSLSKPIIIISISIGILFLGYISFNSIKRKFMGLEELIILVEEINKKNEELYNKLGNYKDEEYTKKFIEYLNFLINNATDVRLDLRRIYVSKPKHKFKTRNLLLIGGNNKNEFYLNVKNKRFLTSDYSLYLEEAKKVLSSSSIYKKFPHKKLGSPYKKSIIANNDKTIANEAKKEYSLSKASYNSYTLRLKEKITLYKTTRKQYFEWKKNVKQGKKVPTESEEGDQTPAEKENKPVFKMSGMSNGEIKETFESMLTKLKLEIPKLRDLKAKAYQKYKVAKSRYKKLRTGSK